MEKNEENYPKMDPNKALELQANFSALLSIAAEQQAMIGFLLKSLLTNQLISMYQLEEITDVHDNEELLTPVFEDVYKKFAKYFLKSKIILENNRLRQAALPEGKNDDGD